MGLIIKTNRLWLLFLVILGSVTVTNKFIQPDNILTDHTSLGISRHIVSAAGLAPYRWYRFPVNIPTASLPHADKPSADPISGADIWKRMRTGFVFPAVDPDVIRTYIAEYVKHPLLLTQVLQRGEPYLFHILDRLEQAGMPAELALLPVIESAFDPFATSPAGAAGIWQFMPETAAYVGLNQDWWYDGRRDIIASTDAALDYLDRLHKRFNNNWLLTLAAYNAGGTRVKRAIRKNRDAGKPDDFWHLSLPAETQAYVPKLIALRTIIENPQHYNISLPALSDTGYFSTVKIQGQIELRVAAQLAGIPLAILQRLNPGYDRSITPPDTTHTLLFPKSVAHVFRERIARLPHDQRVKSIRHRIRTGDNLSTIAQQYHTTVSVLRKANRLKGSKIITGDFLIVPVEEQEVSIVDTTYAVLM
jgi:membrane-bound lytic murein transglycosylase D